LRQGDAISPLLLNVVLETAIRRSKVEIRGTMFEKCSKFWYILKMWLFWEEDDKMSLVEQTDKVGLKISKKRQHLW